MPLTRPPLSFLNSNSTVFNDPLLVLHQGSTSNDSDVGFVFNRANGLVSNVAVYWSETDKSFYTAFTDSGGAGDANLVPTSYAPITVGTLNANNAVVTGNLTVSGLTTTINTTNSTISDSLIELNSGAGSNSNDLGFIFERGSTGDNAAIIWDESADVFVLGTTTATGASTGDLTVSQVGLHAGSITINSAYTFPTSDGTADQVLTTNGSGTLSFAVVTADTSSLEANIGSFQTYANTTLSSKAPTASPTFTGNLTVDTNTLYVDATNNRVGIGTSSPATALDVAGTVTADGLTVASDSAYAIDVSRPSAGNTTLRITGGATAGNDAIFRADIGNTTGSSGIYFGDTATNGIGRIMYEHNGDYMRFYTSSTEKMRINSSGNVGIGNTAPQSPLTVAGVIESTSGGIKFPDNTTQTTAASAGITEATAIEYAIALG